MKKKTKPAKRAKHKTLLLIGTRETSPDLLYGSGFSAPDPVVLMVRGREKIMLVPPLEEGRAKTTARRGVTVLTPDGLLPARSPAMKSREAWMLALLRKERIRSVTVPRDFPLGAARRLERGGIRVVVAKEPLFDRAVKSADELRRIGGVQRAAAAAVRAATAMIREATADKRGNLRHNGKALTSERVRERIGRVLLAHGCGGPPPIVSCGRHAADPHDIGHGPLRRGETIVMDIFPRHAEHGYWGDITRTVVKGKPSKEVRRMYKAVQAAQKKALGMIKAGAQTGRIHKAVQELFCRLGFKTEKTATRRVGFFHGTGHGVGLEIHERPSFHENNTARLREGNVVTVEPGLYYPQHGGVRIEDTVVVTRRGWRYLGTCGKKLCI